MEAVLTDVTLVCWALFELFLRIWETARGKGRRARDRGTRILVAGSLGLAIGISALATSSRTALELAGVVVMWLGLATRIWAVATLGTSFRTTVEVDPGQAVVTRGPYRWVRHPSYTGLLLIVAGFALSHGTWLSLAACLVVPALVRRIDVEEAELNRVLGDAYRSYQARTARLIPGIW